MVDLFVTIILKYGTPLGLALSVRLTESQKKGVNERRGPSLDQSILPIGSVYLIEVYLNVLIRGSFSGNLFAREGENIGHHCAIICFQSVILNIPLNQ